MNDWERFGGSAFKGLVLAAVLFLAAFVLVFIVLTVLL